MAKLSKKQAQDIAKLINSIEVSTMLMQKNRMINNWERVEIFKASYNEAYDELLNKYGIGLVSKY